MKWLIVPFLLLAAGCTTTRACRDQIDLAKWTQDNRCKQDLDRVAAECADVSGVKAPIYDRGGYGQ